MADESKRSFSWLMLIFLPALLALMAMSAGVSRLSPVNSRVFFMVWCVINTICTVVAAWKLIGPLDNVASRVALTAFFGLLLWCLSAALALFGGCICALVVHN